MEQPHSYTHTHTHTHTCKCRQTWTLKIIWNYNAKTRTRVCEIALANCGHPRRVCDISLAKRGLTPATLLFGFFAFAFVCTISLIKENRGQSMVAVLSSIWFWCVGSCPRFPVKTNAHTHTHTVVFAYRASTFNILDYFEPALIFTLQIMCCSLTTKS